MKILITSFTYPPNKDGVAEAASSLAIGLRERGWDVEVATEKLDQRKVLSEGGIPVHEFSITGTPHRRDPYRGEIVEYYRLLIEGKWDVIIFQGYAWPLYLSLRILDKITAKTILVSHGYGALVWTRAQKFPFGLGQLFLSAGESIKMLFWIKKIDCLVFLSKRYDFLNFFDKTLARLVRHRGIKTIPNGINIDISVLKGSFRKRINVSEETIVFLCVANYSRRKDQGYAARAYRKAVIENSVLVFIGSEFNTYSKMFQEQDALMTNDQTLGRIIWLEKVDREETLQAFADCDICVLSSSHEAQPIVLLEAMKEEKPWISRNAGCISEMEGGLCVENEGSMAESMKKLARDSGLRSHLGNKGLQATRIKYNRKNYLNLYHKIIKDLVVKNIPIQ